LIDHSMPQACDVFISYAAEDRDRAREFADYLEARGWSVWWGRKIPIGRAFDEEIENALRRAWGLPEGVGRLTVAQASHRNATVILLRRGRRNPAHELRVANAAGLTPPVGLGLPIQSVVELNPLPANGADGPVSSEMIQLTRVTFSRDANGRVLEQVGFDRGGRRLYTMHVRALSRRSRTRSTGRTGRSCLEPASPTGASSRFGVGGAGLRQYDFGSVGVELSRAVGKHAGRAAAGPQSNSIATSSSRPATTRHARTPCWRAARR
jgi:hypothetical protein